MITRKSYNYNPSLPKQTDELDMLGEVDDENIIDRDHMRIRQGSILGGAAIDNYQNTDEV